MTVAARRVRVVPEQFTYVKFDHAALVSLARRLVRLLSIGDVEVDIEVDETVPFDRAEVRALDPISLHVESGALEDPLHARVLSVGGSADTLGCLLLRARDMRAAGFGAPPLGADRSLEVESAWDTYCAARLARAIERSGATIAGHRPQVQRRRYAFRIRHGFSDAADDQFARLWAADDLTYPDLVAISELARNAIPA